MKNLRIISILLILIMATTACNSTQIIPNTEPLKINVLVNNQWKGVISSDEKNADYDSFLKYAAQKFMAQYECKNIEFNVEAMSGDAIDDIVRERHGTENAVDVLMSASFSSVDYAHMGWLVPLDDVIDEASYKDISETIWNECRLADKMYFYPFYMLPNTLGYNAELFRQSGLDQYISEKNKIAIWSVEDFDNILARLHQRLPNCAPLMMYAKDEQGDTHTMSLIRSRGTQMFSKNTVDIYNDAGVAGFQWIKDCYDKGYFPKNPQQLTLMDNMDLFANNQLAITILNPTSYNLYSKEGTDFRLANFPSINGPIETVFLYVAMALDNNNVEKIKIAKDFVAYINSDPELVKSSINGVPIRKSVIETQKNNPVINEYANNSKYIVSISNNLPNWMYVRRHYYHALQALLNEEKTAQETALTFQEKANAEITKGNVKSVLLK